MALAFPNSARAHVAAKQCVLFWGYDDAFEVSFELEDGAIALLAARDPASSDHPLDVFDRHRSEIERVAKANYKQRKSTYCRLTLRDMPSA
jgi:hypothetical protein